MNAPREGQYNRQQLEWHPGIDEVSSDGPLASVETTTIESPYLVQTAGENTISGLLIASETISFLLRWATD